MHQAASRDPIVAGPLVLELPVVKPVAPEDYPTLSLIVSGKAVQIVDLAGDVVAAFTRSIQGTLHRPVAMLTKAGRITADVVAHSKYHVMLQISLLPDFFDFDSEDAEQFFSHTDALLEYWHSKYHTDLGHPDYGAHVAAATAQCQLSDTVPALDANGNLISLSPEEVDAEWNATGFFADPDATLRDLTFKMALPSDWRLETPDPAGLRCQLFKYQRRALSWMQWRESLGDEEKQTNALADKNSIKSRLPTVSELWRPLRLPSGFTLYHNWVQGGVSTEAPAPDAHVAGGCLADEMGLGKTVLIIALTLASPPPYKQQPAATAPAAAAGNKASLRGNTLVVCPPALVQQWASELQRHAGDALSVFVYNGLKAKDEKEPAADASKKDEPPLEPRKRSKKGKDGLVMTPEMQREMELFAKLAAGEDPPTENLNSRAADIARTMAQADVVITSLDILRQEVYYNSENKAIGALRRPKRYAVPECPLVQLEWWRLVADEAQMVAPMGATGEMMTRMKAHKRWCVTGTPIASKRELNDIHDLLVVLQHSSFVAKSNWNWRISHPLSLFQPDIATRLLSEQEECAPKAYSWGLSTDAREAEKQVLIKEGKRSWLLLLRALQPMIWRNTKEVVREEYHLPARNLHMVKLRLQPGELDFYNVLVDKCKQHRQDLMQAEADNGLGAGNANSRRKRRRSSVVTLQEEAERDLTELRIACIHPQLTQTWQRDHRGEMQLNSGALSMDTILERMVASLQVELQDTERALCSHLNTLAMVLLGTIPEGGAANAGATTGSPPAGNGDGPSKKRRKSNAPSPEDISQALALLEQSHRLYEKGIDAFDIVDKEEWRKLPEPEQGASASWKAWMKVQLNTVAQKAIAYRKSGMPKDEIAEIERKVGEKVRQLTETAQTETTKCTSKVEELRNKAKNIKEMIVQCATAATEGGFPSDWGLTPDAGAWLEGIDLLYTTTAAEEAVQQEQQNSRIQAVMGKQVKNALEAEERKMQAELNLLENWTSAMKAEAGVKDLQKAVAKEAAGARGAGSDPTYHDLRWMMGRLNNLLPPFRRNTLLSQYQRVMPIPVKKQPLQQHQEANEGGVQQQQDEGGDQAGPRQPDADIPCSPTTQVATDRALQLRLAQMEEQEAKERQGLQNGETEIQLMQECPETDDAELLAAVTKRPQFIASTQWRGKLRGYAFTTGQDGRLGYFRDPEQLKDPSLIDSIHQCGESLSRALHDHHIKTLRQCPPEDVRIFTRAGLEATEAKQQSVTQQIALLRLLKDVHTAECMLTLHTSQLEDIDIEAQQAQQEPLVGLRSPDVLRKQIEKCRDEARGLRGRKRFMTTRLQHELGVPDPTVVATAASGALNGAQQLLSLPEGTGNRLVELGTAASVGGAGPSRRSTRRSAPSAAVVLTNVDPEVVINGQAGGMDVDVDVDAVVQGPQELAIHRPGHECPVCLKELDNELYLFSSCGHAYCVDCSMTLVKSSKMCAVCRTKVTKNQVISVLVTNRRRPMHTEFDAEAAADSALRDVQLQGKWSIKIEALLRRLQALATTAPMEKSLVFSQFPEALKLVSMALKTNDIKHVQLIGGRKAVSNAVTQFHDDDDVRVFLLSHRAGAQGLTLVRANHVFLLEPALDPAIEQQAVARVHRIGQNLPVHINRMLVNETIEEEVLRIQQARQALFHQGTLLIEEGEGEDADLATTVAEASGKEVMNNADAMKLLDAVMRF